MHHGHVRVHICAVCAVVCFTCVHVCLCTCVVYARLGVCTYILLLGGLAASCLDGWADSGWERQDPKAGGSGVPRCSGFLLSTFPSSPSSAGFPWGCAVPVPVRILPWAGRKARRWCGTHWSGIPGSHRCSREGRSVSTQQAAAARKASPLPGDVLPRTLLTAVPRNVPLGFRGYSCLGLCSAQTRLLWQEMDVFPVVTGKACCPPGRPLPLHPLSILHFFLQRHKGRPHKFPSVSLPRPRFPGGQLGRGVRRIPVTTSEVASRARNRAWCSVGV